ncbi:hypothetical protein ECG_03842 [Echinococcus granulosus]|uniref:7TMR-DISM_7TM domain containing protein n=1 Tax=Echinococcus granulosus TaxID=6210 RepID=A0A068WCT9_ECHGR|nr:hypothetical protein ECG_03842 [Echinococcus granulosus]CDS17887.1 7TMR-DISM_7TM domain containing protein [Echinococcus granulosus]
MRTPLCCLPFSDALVTAFRTSRTNSSSMETSTDTKNLTSRLHYAFVGLIFLILASLLCIFEVTTPTPYSLGYWNGALAFLSGATILSLAVFTNQWTLVLLLGVNAFTILACIIAALTSMKAREERHLPSYWVCLATLMCSVYSMIFVLVKYGLDAEDVSRQSSAFILAPQEMSSRQQTIQPPEGFILPSEVPYLPDYDNLSDPPSYREAIGDNAEKSTPERG